MRETHHPTDVRPRVRRDRGEAGAEQRRRLEFGRSSLSRGPDRAYEQSRRGRPSEEAHGPARRIRRQHELGGGRPIRNSASIHEPR